MLSSPATPDSLQNPSPDGLPAESLSQSLSMSRASWQRPVSAWQQPGPAAFDFRSDVTTTATPRLLQAVMSAGLNDGWTGNGAKKFEEYMAQLVGTESAVFMVSSTMGNQVAIRTHLNRPPNGVICDARSHIMHMETGGLASLSGALPIAIYPSNGVYLTLEDIERYVVLSDGTDACNCPTRLLHLENPLGGNIMPLHEMKRIKEFADCHGLKIHVDGARLWEAVVAQHGSLRDFASGAHSVNLCLSKGLGVPMGSIVVGDAEFIRHARWVRKSMGGAMRQPGIMANCAWAAVEEAFGQSASGDESLLSRGHELARDLANHWAALDGKLVVPQETNVIWLDLDALKIDEDEWESQAKAEGILLHSSRILTHYQLSDEAVAQLKGYMQRSLEGAKEREGYVPRAKPRNDAVSRVAAAMKEAMMLARLRNAAL
ncbi:l-allo-threonine aldolase [Amniculicola lignicola CBS 123094]|uniref:L-allo-threonine aldolase n=1 Tax=Amniculicola lignicola CBS 123094 TaxID=1392246 RepID=A0A6A5W5L1_9PLEO|nr:l-allo-threonine aldolase [Amniculicola lignicola CBS 123094]